MLGSGSELPFLCSPRAHQGYFLQLPFAISRWLVFEGESGGIHDSKGAVHGSPKVVWQGRPVERRPATVPSRVGVLVTSLCGVDGKESGLSSWRNA